jgi:hypothetical protein
MKQTALQQLISWGDERLKNEPMKLLSFAEVIDKAEELLEVEKEQMLDVYSYGMGETHQWDSIEKMFEQYFKETYERIK